jgi:hypothetical protein
MPLREYADDVGFDAPPVFSPDAPQPEQPGGGGFFEGIGAARHFIQPLTTGTFTPESQLAMGAAFQIENDVLNAWQMLTAPTFEDDLNFDLEANLKAAGLWEEDRWKYVGVQSPGEFLYKTRKIKQERAARMLLEASGPGGIVSSIIAGAASPTVLLPFVGPGVKGAKAVAVGAAWGLAGGFAQEIPLQLNQELRTLEESAVSVGFSTVLGGVLGGGIGFLNRSVKDFEVDMAPAMNGTPIPPSADIRRIEGELADLTSKRDALLPDDPARADYEAQIIASSDALEDARIRSAEQVEAFNEHVALTEALNAQKKTAAGADVVEYDAGKLKGMLGIGEKLTWISPVTSNLGQPLSAQLRVMQANLSTTGLRLEGNLILTQRVVDPKTGKVISEGGEVIGTIPSNENGTVESIINSRRAEANELIQEAYSNHADYFFGATKPKKFANTRASVQSIFQRGASAKLNRRQFFEQVGEAMWAGDVHAIPEVQKTAQAFRKHYNNLLKEAQDAGVISQDLGEAIKADPSYLNRVYDTAAINRNPNRFVDMLANHFEKVLEADVAKMHERFVKADAHDAQRLADADLPLEEAKALRDGFKKELDALISADAGAVGPIEDLISGLRSDMSKTSKQIRDLEQQLETGPTNAKFRTPLLAQVAELKRVRDVYNEGIDELKRLGGSDLEERAAKKAELKRRIRGLDRSRYMVEAKLRAKLDQIEIVEESNVTTINRAIAAGRRALAATEKVGEDFDRAMKSAGRAIETATRNIQRHGKLRQKFINELPDGELTPEASAQYAAIKGEGLRKVDNLETVNEDLQGLLNAEIVEGGQVEARAAIQDALDDLVDKANQISLNRGKRIAKLEAAASKFDDAAWLAKRAEIEERIRARKEKLRERVQEMGAEDFDITTGKSKFTQHARDIAQTAKDKITGVNMRLAGFDVMSDARGAELARTLTISSKELSAGGFLVNDAEHLIHAYSNTMIPDIELTKRFGAFAPDGSLNIQFKQLNEEMHNLLRQSDADFRAKAAKAGKPVDEAELEKLQARIHKAYAKGRDNLDAQFRRLRNQWGIPKEPEGWAARGVNIVLAFQALRLLGKVAFASAPDIGRPIARYGLNRTMRTAWKPLVTNLKSVKMTQREAQRAYVAVEVMTSQRAFALADLIYGAGRKSKFEEGLEWTTSKMGLIALFSPWTDVMKTLSTMAFHDKFFHSIEQSLHATARSGKDFNESLEFLASLGINENMQRRIWDQMSNGGAEKIDGAWIPQTERWTDKEAVKAMRAATYSEAAVTITTPGIEIPKMANATLVGRLLFNLKSFALASTSKTLMAGLQQRDKAVLNGTMISLALGALSFYLRAVATGGLSEQRMREASWQVWADETLSASGLLGAFDIAQRIAGDLPGVRDVTSFSGGQASRSTGAGLVEDVGGPVMSLTMQMAQIMTGADNPTRAQIHRVRQLLPFQNLFYLTRLFDAVENATGDSLNSTGTRR